MATEITDSEKLGHIACLYSGMRAIIQSYYAVVGNLPDDKRTEDMKYGLIMALEALTDRVGEHAGVI